MAPAAAVTFVVVLTALAALQAALAAGAPLGRFAFGGQHDGALPAKLRVASALTILVYACMAVIVLDAAGLTDLLGEGFETVAIWVLVALLALNIIPNAMSRSRPERLTMTPVLVILTACALVVAVQQ
ncbi:hypothetical protein [Demequina sp. NBRC 110053]|uniref:hypothetical protein n=1 Tax=Demequina sp. NBRC 110053 TaxID=1570342 RepID=UPI000A0167D3|nr:hypothetical protein [Demequina sp. NBRC 110053]